MFETLDKLVLAGLGALTMTRERAEEIFEEAVQRGQEKRVNQQRFVEDLIDSGQGARAKLEELVARQVRQAIHQMNLATREDLLRLETKIDQLLSKAAV